MEVVTRCGYISDNCLHNMFSFLYGVHTLKDKDLCQRSNCSHAGDCNDVSAVFWLEIHIQTIGFVLVVVAMLTPLNFC